MKAEDKRKYLKAAGWRRCDRAIGPDKSVELWAAPGPWVGLQPLPMTLDSAYKKQLKAASRLNDA